MTFKLSVKRALRLLNKQDKSKLILSMVLQIVLSIFDLLGVILIGFIAAVATYKSTSSNSGSMPILSRFGIDSTEVTDKTILFLALIASVLLLVKSISSFLMTKKIFHFLAHRQVDAARHIETDFLNQPLVEIQRIGTQEVAYALTTGVSYATLGILGNFMIVLAELISLAVLGLGLLALDPIVTIFTVFYFGAMSLVLYRLLSKFALTLGDTFAQAEVASYQMVQQTILTFRESFVGRKIPFFIDEFARHRNLASKTQANIQILATASKYAFEIGLLVGGSILVISQVLTKDTAAAVGTIVIFLVAASRILPSLLRLQSAAWTVQSSAGMASSVFELMDSLEANEHLRMSRSVTSEDASSYEFNVMGNPAYEVQIKNISLTYPGSAKPAVHGISFSLAHGNSLAIVGPTGSGKSTLADLLLGIQDPDQGNVSIGGLEPLRMFQKYPGFVGYVPQSVSLVSGSVRENVAFGVPGLEIDDKQVWKALEQAHLADFLISERDGIDTYVGESGVNLSGGQRQRLGIARALYTSPRVLVLDEATSALDAGTEAEIGETLNSLEGKVTLIVIAHRLSTIRNCDFVMYLDGGECKAMGSFSEVVAAVPDFAQQINLFENFDEA